MNIYIYDKEKGLPDDDTCYLIGKNGPYLKKTLELISSLTPVDKISFLDDIPTYAEIHIPKIPVKVIAKVVSFFKKVYEMYHSEAVVLLYYNKSKKTYKIHVPKQVVAAAGLDYKSDLTIPKHILIGDIHSHGNMGAFHSPTDVHDESKFDGLHITIGKISSQLFEVCGSVAVNNMRVPIIPEDYIAGITSAEYSPYFPTMFRPAFDEINGEKIYKNEVKTYIGYTLNASEKDYKFNEEWLNQVEEKKYEPVVYNFQGNCYIYKDGKLIATDLKSEDIQTSFDFRRGYVFDERNVDQDFDPILGDSCVCSRCIHRCKKLELQSLENISEDKLEDEFLDEYYFGW